MKVKVTMTDEDGTVLERFDALVEDSTLARAGLPAAEVSAAIYVRKVIENHPWITTED